MERQLGHAPAMTEVEDAVIARLDVQLVALGHPVARVA
jgi:hypothetical protein